MKDVDQYMMGFARHARTRANCLKREVGAVLMRDNFLIATGYNGTSAGVRNCTEGGCTRCYNSEDYPTGQHYDLCVCVHGEENTFLQAARFGRSVDGAILYTTLQPCLGCLKSAINAGVAGIVFDDSFIVPLEQREDYNRMVKALSFFKRYVEPEPDEIAIRHKITTQN